MGSGVGVHFGDGVELRGESVVSDSVPVLCPSMLDRTVCEDVEVVEAVSEQGGGCPELVVGALCMVFTGR